MTSCREYHLPYKWVDRWLGCVLAICILNITPVAGQDPVSGTFKENPDSLRQPQAEDNDLLEDFFDNDTIQVKYYMYGQPYRVMRFDDSLLSEQFRQMDPGRRAHHDYLHLGNFGSPAYPVLFQPEMRDVFDVGIHTYDSYAIRFDNFRFYYPETPFTHVRYGTTTGVRDDNIFRGVLSRDFAKTLNVSLEFNRINQFGNIQWDKTRNTNFGVGFTQQIWKNKLKYHLLYTFNQYLRQENGGITSDSSLLKPGLAGVFLSLPVYNLAAGSKNSDWGILLNNELQLGRTPDSLGRSAKRQGLSVGWEISFRKQKGLYYDTDVSGAQDIIYYRGLNTDIRGIRNAFWHGNFSNMVYLEWKGKERSATETHRNHLKAGLTYEQHRMQYAPVDSSFGILKLNGSGLFGIHFNQSELAAKARGYYLLNSLTPVFDIQAEVDGLLNKIAGIGAAIQIRNSPAAYLFEHLHLNGAPTRETRLDHIFQTYLSARVDIPLLKLTGEIHQNIVNNYTYFDDAWIVKQLSSVLSVTGISAGHRLKWKFINFDNKALWQKVSDKTVRIPELITRHAIYFESKLFKKHLLLQTGVEGRYFSAFDRRGYSPLLFNFYNPAQTVNNERWNYDFFIAYKIRLLRGFVRADNMDALFSKKPFYLINGYPQDRFVIRLGFDWIFNN